MPTSFFKKTQDFLRKGSRVPSWQFLFSVQKNPLVPVFVAAAAGIALVDFHQWVALACIASTMVFLFAILLRRRIPATAITLAAILALLLFGSIHFRTVEAIHEFPLADALQKAESIEVGGKGWLSSRPVSGKRSLSGTFHLESLQIGGREIACSHRVPIWIQGSGIRLSYGDSLQFSGVLRPLEPANSPGGFDPQSFYYRQSGSLARLEIREGDSFTELKAKKGSRFLARAHELRNFLEEGLRLGVAPEDEPYARLIAAMSLGARENSPEELEESFRLSGTMHIFAVSGLHVAIVCGLLLGTLLLFRVPRRYAVLIVIPLVLFYAVLTGLRPSAIRAAIMLSVVLAGFALREQPRLTNSLALAGLLILGFDTQQLFLPGFQLSFAVLLFIALFADPVRKSLARPWLTDPFIPKTLLRPVQRWKDKAVVGITAALAISLLSWLGSLGLLTWHFKSFSPVGILANLFLVPMAGFVVGFAVASLAFFGTKMVWITAILNKLNVLLAIALTWTAQFFAGLPGAHRHSGDFFGDPPAENALVIDVMGEKGEGAALLSFPAKATGHHSRWMLDTGGTRTYQRQMLPTLRTRGINRIDALVLSHGDIGHIGAAPRVLAQLGPRLIFEGKTENRSTVYPKIKQLAEARNIEVIPLLAEQRLLLGETASGNERILRVLAPTRGENGRLADDRVLVLKLSQGDWRILFTSDAGFETEKHLLESGENLRADVWIRGQHSESPSGLSNFVDAISPRVVISSSAEFPSSQRIRADFRENLAEKDALLLPLDETGVITLTFTETELRIHSHRQKRDLLVLPAPRNQ